MTDQPTYHLFVNTYTPYEGFRSDAMGSYQGAFPSVEAAKEAVVIRYDMDADICAIVDGRLEIIWTIDKGEWRLWSEIAEELE